MKLATLILIAVGLWFWPLEASCVLAMTFGFYFCCCVSSCEICCAADDQLPTQLKISLSGSTGTFAGSGDCTAPNNDCSNYDGDYIVDLLNAAQYAGTEEFDGEILAGGLPGACRSTTAAADNCKWASAEFNTTCYYGLFDARRFFLFMTNEAGTCRLRAAFDFESFPGNAAAMTWVKSEADGGICLADLPVTLSVETGACTPHPCDPTFGTLTVDLP